LTSTHNSEIIASSGMAKRKLSRKARAAAIKNLAKARRARKRKHTSHVKSPRRKNRVSKKQRAAARRNIKKAIAGKRRKKACRRAAGKRGAAKRAGRRMPKMPKACKPKRKKGRRRVKSAKRSSGKRKSAKRVRAGKKAARTRRRHLKKDHQAKHPRRRKDKRKAGKRKTHRRKAHRKSRKRVLAGKKAAATRKARRAPADTGYDQEPEWGGADEKRRKRRKRKGHRKGRRKNPIVVANPVRRRHRRRNPINPFMRNPIQGPAEFVAGLFGVGMGYVAANLVDRLLATHPLVASSSGYVDSPPAGQIYDSEAPLTPIWTSPVRFIAGIGMIFVPGVLSRFAPGNTFKAFLQLASYGAAAQVAGKAISDGIAAFAPSNSLVLQAYGPEVAAQTKLASVSGGTAASIAAPGFGRPARQLTAPAKVGCGACGGSSGGCANCSQTISTDAVADAQNAQSSGQPFFATGLDSGSLHWQTDPAVDPQGNNPDDCAPMPVVAPTLNTMPGGGPAATAPPPTTQLPYSGGVSAEGGGPIIPATTTPAATPAYTACPPGMTYNAVAGKCVAVGAPPGIANGTPAPTSQTVPTRTVTPSAAPVTAVPHIIA
jgi:hypothetical protein